MKVSQDTHIYLPPETPPDLEQQLGYYLENLARRLGKLPLSPLDPTGRESAHLTLEQVYVGLDARPPQRLSFGGQAGEVRAVLAAVANQERLVILGDPGSGKSTFLRYLALRLAQAHLNPEDDWRATLRWPVYAPEGGRDAERLAARREDKEEPLGEQAWPHPPYLPVMVTLRDFAAGPFMPDDPLALWKFIQTDLERLGLGDTAPALEAVLRQGEGIFLLDGVDEVPPDRRPQVWAAIGALGQSAFNGCRWLATCRVLSFVEDEAEAAEPTTKPVTLAPLGEGQIEQFVQAWYEALVADGALNQAKGESLARQLIRAAGGPLRELAENPMLLTIMALVQTFYGTLPHERAKLYQACIETLLLRWQQSKEAEEGELPASLVELELKPETVEPLLWEIGWVAHAEQAGREGAADIAEEQVIGLARKHLGSYAKAEAFIEYTERRAHLLMGLGGERERRYSFPHRTFQEYLAACHLANHPRFGRQATPLAEAGAPWREVLLLAAGTLVYNNQRIGRYVLLNALEHIMPQGRPEPGDTSGWQRVWRAGEMLAVLGAAAAAADDVGAELLPRLRADLAALLAGGELAPAERAEAGQPLAALGDPRPGVGLKDGLPDILWREVPAGEFVMGDDAGDADEKPAHTLTLPAFQISQYPITNAQFAAFVAAEGYRQRRYWAEAEAAGYWRDGMYRWPEPRDRPYDFGSPYNLANHPVVGISWYEAVAFCRWLSEKVGYLVRLPSEAEWEKAARGPDGRAYPWGDDEARAGQANSDKAGITTTCAVGLFPAGVSPYGVHDMSGNVWEWCSTLWVEKAYPFQVTDEWTTAYLRQDKFRVLRGGSVRVASRNGFDPLDWFRHHGCRVVRPPL